MSKWRGPTVRQIAAASGLSTATVDRVLNRRGPVRAERVAQVEAALQRLGARERPRATDNGANGRDAGRNPLRLALLCVSGESFRTMLAEAAHAQAQESRGDVVFEIEMHGTLAVTPLQLGARLRALGQVAHGVLLVAWDDPAISAAVRELVSRGTPVICFTTDLPLSGRTAYVGMDQVMAGCNAAYLLGRLAGGRRGRVALFYSAPFRCQEDREIGFRRVMRSDFPNLSVEERQGSHDDPGAAYRALTALLTQPQPPIGVYNVSGGNTGIAQALDEAAAGASTMARCAFVGHELTLQARRMLASGSLDFLLHHDMAQEMREAVTMVRGALEPESPPMTDRISRPKIVTRYLI